MGEEGGEGGGEEEAVEGVWMVGACERQRVGLWKAVFRAPEEDR